MGPTCWPQAWLCWPTGLASLDMADCGAKEDMALNWVEWKKKKKSQSQPHVAGVGGLGSNGGVVMMMMSPANYLTSLGKLW